MFFESEKKAQQDYMSQQLAQDIHPECLHTTLAGYDFKIHQNQIKLHNTT